MMNFAKQEFNGIGGIKLKSEEQLKKQLATMLRAQADRVEADTLESNFSYKIVSQHISALEDVLELNVYK